MSSKLSDLMAHPVARKATLEEEKKSFSGDDDVDDMDDDAIMAAIDGRYGNKNTNIQKPGYGWSNGQINPEMFPVTRNGKLQLYSSQRRWLHLTSSWSRITKGETQYSKRTSFSHTGQALVSSENLGEEAHTVRCLIAQMCEQFYRVGWATGTGGGVSVRVGGPTENRPWRVFVAPSGIQKEDMIGDDIFELDMDRNVVVPPKTPNLKQSACTPIWYVVYRNRPTAKAVIHTHSMYAQMATLLDPTESSDCLRLTHLEMLKGVGNHAYDDILEIPIIDNRPSEDLLADQVEAAIKQYPNTNALLVRRHGVYVWGDSWEQAKTQCEAFDYLFKSAIDMKKVGIDCSQVPLHGTYRIDDEEELERARKRIKTGFNGLSKSDNLKDLISNEVPILPRDGKHILLDIEGCTTCISFVKETLFPFIIEHIDTYAKSLTETETTELVSSLKTDLESMNPPKELLDKVDLTDVSSMVKFMVSQDYKVPALKTMQGKVWKFGYEQGDLKGHVFSDFVPFLQWMESNGVHVHIYSSGSVQAQKLLFGHSIQGDLKRFLHQYFDITTSGNKKVAKSYTNIANSLGIKPSDLTFVSDSEAELKAATEAGLGHVIMSIRPHNVPLTATGKQYTSVFSLLQLCGK